MYSRIPEKIADKKDYLVKKYDTQKTLAPQNEDEEIQYQQWLHFAEGTMMTPLVLLLVS